MRNRIQFITSFLLFSHLLIVPFISKAIYTPVLVTGFNADVVAEIPGNAAASTSNDYDGVNYVWMTSTFNPAGPSYIPIGGIINSVVASTPGLQYQLASYTANNSLRLAVSTTGALNFSTPQSAQTVYVLGSTGSGNATATITITFTDLTTQVFTGIFFPDWYNGPNFAIQGCGRTNRVTNIISNDAVNPRLYQAPLALLPANYSKLIQSVSFANTVGGGLNILNIMAISIDTPPIPCTGTPNAGNAISTIANPCPGASVNINLSGATAASNLAYQWLQATNCVGPWVPILGVTNPSALTVSLFVSAIAGTTLGYRCKVTCLTSGLSDTSSLACVSAQPWSCTSPCFGISSALDSTNQDIFNVTVGTINNTTNCVSPLVGSQGNAVGAANRYADFTGVAGVPSGVVYKGLLQPFSLSIGTCAANVGSSVKIYIDFNHNSLFTDVNEEVYSNTSITSVNPTAIISGSFLTPASAITGCTKMRVVMSSTSSGIINPTGTYAFGETEDYLINIIQPSLYDPAISAINVQGGNCFTANETVITTLCNYGSDTIDLASNNVTISLYVAGPLGINTYTVNATSGLLMPYGATCIPVNFTGIDMYNGGNYAINTSLVISGLANGNLLNDSLNLPIYRVNYRPIGGPDYQVCQDNIIPFGQGLTVSGCATSITDSVEVLFTLSPGQPPICSSTLPTPTNACQFATAILPVLPLGASLSDAILTVTNLASASLGCITCVWPNEKRFSLFKGIAPPTLGANTFFAGAIGNNATTGANAQGYTYTNIIAAGTVGTIFSNLGPGGTLKLGSWDTFNTTLNNHVINFNGNPTVAKLKIFYTYVPANYEWYADSVGGPILYTYSPFNPVGVIGSGITNTNTAGITPFYASCAGSSTCRIPVNFVINPLPTVIQDTLTLCEYSQASNSAAFDLTLINGSVSAFNPLVTVNYFGDQSLFLPILNPTNDTSGTNYIYSKVTNPATGCFSSDTVLLKVNSIPQFISNPIYGNVCAPNSIDVASLIAPFTTTVGADTLFYEDPLCTIFHPNPHAILTLDTVYMVLVTNTIPACSDTTTALVNIVPASNYIVNQNIAFNYSTCNFIGCGNVILGDGMTETLYTTTDCRKIASVKDLPNGISLGSTSICEDIDCSVQFHNSQPYVNRHYKITPTNNDSAEVCLYYLEQDFAEYNSVALGTWDQINPMSNLCISKIDNGDIITPGHTAISIPNTAITSTYDPVTTIWKVCFKVDSFSYFYCHACNPLNTPLPVTLLNFTGKRLNDATSELKWISSSEQNNSHFIIERSKDGKTFFQISNAIKTKAVNGNSNVEIEYNYIDNNPYQGHNYYKLQQVDIDEQISYSNIIDIYYANETMVTLFPNPVNTELTIEINTPVATNAITKIIDATGKVVRIFEMNLQLGNNSNKINIQNLADGMYLISISNSKGLNYSQPIRKR